MSAPFCSHRLIGVPAPIKGSDNSSNFFVLLTFGVAARSQVHTSSLTETKSPGTNPTPTPRSLHHVRYDVDVGSELHFFLTD